MKLFRRYLLVVILFVVIILGITYRKTETDQFLGKVTKLQEEKYTIEIELNLEENTTSLIVNDKYFFDLLKEGDFVFIDSSIKRNIFVRIVKTEYTLTGITKGK